MILGVAAWIASAAFLLSLTSLVHRVVRPQRVALRPVSFLILAMFLTTLLQLLFGLAGLLRPEAIGIFSLLGLGAAWLTPSTRRPLLEGVGEFREGAHALNSLWRAWPAWLRILTVLLLTTLGLRFAFLIWALPPFVWDSLTYHLPNVAAWTQMGRIYIVESPVSRMMSPANYEVLATWFTVFLHHDIFVEASGLPAYALGVAAVYALARCMGLARCSSWLAALGYATTPALLLAATGTKNDPMMAALFLAMLALGWDIAARTRGSAEGTEPGEMLVIVAAFLLALGTKAYILQLGVGLLVVVLCLSWRNGGAAVWHDWVAAWRHTWGTSRVSFRWATVVLLAGGLLLGSYWYARNWVVTGNPLYPYGVEVGSETLVGAAEAGAKVQLSDFTLNLKSLLDRLGDKQRRISPDLPETTGWGWVAYGMGVPALLWGFIRRPRQRILFGGLTASLLLVVLASPTALWLTRFLIWYPAVFCLALGDCLEAVGGVLKLGKAGFPALFVVCSALNLAMTLNYNIVTVDEFASMLRLPALERDAARLRLTVPEEYAIALDIVPREAVLGYNVHGNGFTYPLYRSDFSQRLTYVPVPTGSTCQSIAQEMERRGTRYLFVAPEHTDDWVLGLLNDCANRGDVLRERARGLYVIRRG